MVLESTAFKTINANRFIPYEKARSGSYEHQLGAEGALKDAEGGKCICVLLKSKIVARTTTEGKTEDAFELITNLEGTYTNKGADKDKELTENDITDDFIKKAVFELYPLLIHQTNICAQLMGYRAVVLKSGLDEIDVKQLVSEGDL